MHRMHIVPLPHGVSASLADGLADARELDAGVFGVPRHPDQEGLADQVLFRNRAPATAVVGTVAVVTHREIFARWHDALEILARPVGIDEDVVADRAGRPLHPVASPSRMAERRRE